MQPSALTGPQKAVLMLLSLDEATATPILAEMDPEDVKKLRDAAAGLRAVPTTSLDGVYAEFIERSRTAVAVPKGRPGALKAASRLLEDAKGSGLVRRALDAAGFKDAAVAPLIG